MLDWTFAAIQFNTVQQLNNKKAHWYWFRVVSDEQTGFHQVVQY